MTKFSFFFHFYLISEGTKDAFSIIPLYKCERKGIVQLTKVMNE